MRTVNRLPLQLVCAQSGDLMIRTRGLWVIMRMKKTTNGGMTWQAQAMTGTSLYGILVLTLVIFGQSEMLASSSNGTVVFGHLRHREPLRL